MNYKKITHLSMSLMMLFCMFSHISTAQKEQGLQTALTHLQNNFKELGLTNKDIGDFKISDHYTTKHNGVTHVYLLQRSGNLDVFNAMLNINVLPNGKILNINNDFIPDLDVRINTTQATISAADALGKVISHFDIQTNESLRIKEEISDQHFIFENEGIALQEVPVHLIFQPMEDKTVKLAWNVKLYTLDAQNWYNVRVDATDGSILHSFNQVIHCDFGSPNEICENEGHVHNIQTANISDFVNKNEKRESATMLANSYNVYPMPIESPNHGDRELVTDPATPFASPFGWHDIDQVAGPEYTITRGNNVHAYHDIFNLNNDSNDEPDGGNTLDFDFPIDDPTHPYVNVDAAVTNLFYWTNTMHDLWYQYGFDEAAGNFQENNYGNGGDASDYLRAEALDASGTNNANMATDTDGNNPRMQMYIWGPGGLPSSTVEFSVTAPEDYIGDYQVEAAGFGAVIPSVAIVSQVVLVDDGTGPDEADACEDIINGSEIDGKIAMINRGGGCQFGHKVLKAENLGAIAVIVCNDVGTDPFPMGPGIEGDQVTIPSVMLSLDDCTLIKMGLPELTVSLGGGDSGIPMPGPAAFDGDYDSGIIAHEYTHGISIRLTGGANNAGCLSGFEQAGEGWSDWFALTMTTTAEMAGNQNHGIGTYATGEPTSGTGIRTYPYTTNMGVNPHTYADINNETVPHGVGSVWCAMIWDMYWNLVEVYDFDTDFFEGTGGNNIAMQLVLDGLKLQGCNPSFIDARDAIIAADIANNEGVNVCLIWETFANRGLGASAAAGGVEAFDLPEECTFTLKINKSSLAISDAGGTMTYTLDVTNDYPDDLSNVIVTDQLPEGTTYVGGSSSCGGEVLDGKLTFTIPSIPAGTTVTCTFEVTIADFPFSFLLFEDNMDNGNIDWEVSNGAGAFNWAMDDSNPYGSGNFAWYASDEDSQCDQYLEMTNPTLIEGNNPILLFWHEYDTETDWDGGVVEISADGGAWVDLGNEMTQNGYGSNLEVNAASAISGQPAFHGRSTGYIQTIVDLSDYVDQEVKIRFRMVCDGFVGADGWYIGQVQIFGSFHSITNEACASSSLGENVCSSTSTIIMGDPTVATETLSSNDPSVSIYPNPTNGKVKVSFANNFSKEALTLKIYSVDGRLLKDQKIEKNKESIDLDFSDFGAGVYMINVQTPNTSIMKKLIVD